MSNEEDKEDNESTSSSYSLGMESAAFYSPGSGSKTPNTDQPKVAATDGQSTKSENKALNLENKSPSNNKVLEDRIIALKHEIETLNCQKGEHEHEQEFHKRLKENSGVELEFAFKEKEGDVLKKLDEREKFFNGKIEESMDRVKNLETEVDSLRSQYKSFSHQKEQELESLRIQNQESEFKLGKKTKEALDSLEMLERLTVQNQETEFKLGKKTKEASDSLEMLERLTVQNQETELELGKKSKEASDSLELLERLTVQNQETELELGKKSKEAADSLEMLERLTVQNQEKEFELGKKTKEASDSLEMLKRLTVQNQETEFELSKKTKEASDSLEMLKRLTVQNQEMEFELGKKSKEASDSLEMLERLTVQNQEMEFKLGKKSKEAADSSEMLERLTEKLKQKTENEEGLVKERDTLKQQVKDLEVKLERISDDNRLAKYENDNQTTTIFQQQEELQEKDSHIAILESEIEGVKWDLSNKMKSLEQKFKLLETDKTELEGKNGILAASLEQRDMQVNKINNDASSSFRATVKKMGEMVDDFKKKTEDSVRILGRRIHVAEQLHNETRDWYKKTRDKNKQDRKDSELALRSIKIMISMVNDTLSISETFGLQFVECCEAFTNRVSKVYCEINFMKDWMRIKNGALEQVKKDFDELVVQLDDKEKEILWSRTKVLKSEGKLRDLKKIVKENDETMIVLKEEKREAIRQLCVWIDYHRGRSDFFKKAFFELVATYGRPGYTFTSPSESEFLSRN